MQATRNERLQLASFIHVKRLDAAQAAEAHALAQVDDGPCTPLDHAAELGRLESHRLAAALALQAESLERQLAA